jgi:hypothetical protein
MNLSCATAPDEETSQHSVDAIGFDIDPNPIDPWSIPAHGDSSDEMSARKDEPADERRSPRR